MPQQDDTKSPNSAEQDTAPAPPAGKVRVRILYEKGSIGPGKIGLLEAIARTGSISAAARELDMTFRRGWQLLETMNEIFREPVVKTVTGGKAGGGATLTPFGEELIAHFRALETVTQAAAVPHLARLDAFLAPGPQSGAPEAGPENAGLGNAGAQDDD